MFSLDRDNDTICAIATAPGNGGIAVLRLSGKAALEVGQKLCPFLPSKPDSHRVYYGFLEKLDPDSDEKKKLDEVLVTYFAEGRSFTGEETLEVSCHGGRFLSSLILQELLSAGARLAQPGEFTYRAFMNQRIDLVQAEAVLELVHSENAPAAQLALRQLEGGFSAELKEIKEELTLGLAHLEANIDFSSEDIQIASNDSIKERLLFAQVKLDALIAQYKLGRRTKEGLSLILIGEPNAGKSSLLNALVKEEKAIVTEVPGTTRDIVEGVLEVDGLPVKLIDTAGFRETDDPVEVIGIKRMKEYLPRADFVFVLVDGSLPKLLALDLVKKSVSADKIIVGFSKSDLFESDQEKELRELVKEGLGQETFNTLSGQGRLISFSSVSGVGLSELLGFLREEVGKASELRSTGLINVRHFELLTKAHSFVNEGIAALGKDESPELVAEEFHSALRCVYEILGERFDDQVMDRVFKEFCLGK